MSKSTRVITLRVSDKDLMKVHAYVRHMGIPGVNTIGALARLCIQLTADVSDNAGPLWQGTTEEARAALTIVYGEKHLTRACTRNYQEEVAKDALASQAMAGTSFAMNQRQAAAFSPQAAPQQQTVPGFVSSFRVSADEHYYIDWCQRQSSEPWSAGFMPEDYYAWRDQKEKQDLERFAEQQAEREAQEKMETNRSILGAIPANLEIV